MKVLAVDTALNSLGICLLDSGVVQANYYASCKKKQAEIILPVIKSLLNDVAVKLADVDAYVLSRGPGSYTGIRVGMSVLKTFAQVHQKPLITLNTLQTLAAQVSPLQQTFSVLLNCSRNDVFYANFKYQDGIPVPVSSTCLSSLDALGDFAQTHSFFFKSITARPSALALSFISASLPSISPIPETRMLYHLAEPQLHKQDFLKLEDIQPFYLKPEVS